MSDSSVNRSAGNMKRIAFWRPLHRHPPTRGPPCNSGSGLGLPQLEEDFSLRGEVVVVQDEATARALEQKPGMAVQVVRDDQIRLDELKAKLARIEIYRTLLGLEAPTTLPPRSSRRRSRRSWSRRPGTLPRTGKPSRRSDSNPRPNPSLRPLPHMSRRPWPGASAPRSHLSRPQPKPRQSRPEHRPRSDRPARPLRASCSRARRLTSAPDGREENRGPPCARR